MKEDIDKKRNSGRPHEKWLGLIKKDTGLPVATAEKNAKNKNKWGKNINITWKKPLFGHAQLSQVSQVKNFELFGYSLKLNLSLSL